MYRHTHIHTQCLTFPSISQVSVAIYVFYKSWSGDKKLLIAAISIFVGGITKCFEKPWALKNASINSLVSSSSTNEDDNAGDISSLENIVQAATEYLRAGLENQQPPEQIVGDKPYDIFIDIAPPFSERLNNLKCMVHANGNEAHRLLKSGLSRAFDRLYNKDQVSPGMKMLWDWRCSSKDWLTQLLREITSYLWIAAIVLFHKMNKEAYDDKDVKITYTLLYCKIFMEEVFSLENICVSFNHIAGLTTMPDQVSQYNLIGYLARNRKHSWFRKLATLLVCKDYLDQLWCMKPCKSSSDITAIVHDHVRDAWKKHVIVDVSTYRDFHDIRGQWALERWGLLDILGPSLQRPFDESVLLWHLATDFCFYSTDASCTSSSHSQHTIAARDLSRKISNYMMYLLFVNPEMLMAGARRNLFRAAYCELKDLLKDNEGPPLNARKLTGKIVEDLKKVSCPQEQTPSASRQHFVPCAYWEVAKPLLSIKDEEKMWLAIQGVWVEMLCFSARRCRGYLHAKSLGKGGEYLSYVWLLQLYMGMETSAEILQRTRLQQEGTASATPTRPTNTVGDNNV